MEVILEMKLQYLALKKPKMGILTTISKMNIDEIISLLRNSGSYENHKDKLRMAAFNAMQNDRLQSGTENE